MEKGGSSSLESIHATYVQYVYLSSRNKSLCKKDTYLNRLEYLTFSNLRDSYNQEFRSKDNTLAECKRINLLSCDISTILALLAGLDCLAYALLLLCAYKTGADLFRSILFLRAIVNLREKCVTTSCLDENILLSRAYLFHRSNKFLSSGTS